MKAVRRFGFILLVLIVGILIGHMQLTTILLIVCPLLVLWLILWDDKRFRANELHSRMATSPFDAEIHQKTKYSHYE